MNASKQQSTKIVRKIDSLGRVVIPKEYRNWLQIKDGDPLEIIGVKDGVLIKKHNSIKAISEVLDNTEHFICQENDLGNKDEIADKFREIKALLKAND